MLSKIIDIFICLTPYPRIDLTPCIQFTLWIVCQYCAPGMPGLGCMGFWDIVGTHSINAVKKKNSEMSDETGNRS
jgi:hypothetical protein